LVKWIQQDMYRIYLEGMGFLEVKRWPMHYTDNMILDEIQNDDQLISYAILGEGIALITVGAMKSYLVNIPRKSRQTQLYRKGFRKTKRNALANYNSYKEPDNQKDNHS